VRFIRHSAAVAVMSGVAVASLALPLATAQGAAKPAAAPNVTTPSAAAAGYLARNLVGPDKDHYLYAGSKYADDGETADAVLSFDAAGVAQAAARRATKWLEQDAANYAGTVPNVYPGSAAKLLLVAEAQHVNPHKFGSLDLVAALTQAEGAGGAAPGEYQNPMDTTYGASVIAQSLAVLALSNLVEAGTAQPSAKAVTFLANQQCADGSFQYDIRATPGTTACTAPDIDMTSYAIQALIAGGDGSDAATALAWLRSQQNPNGGWGETPGVKPEANSTAIAVEAQLAGHRSAAAGYAWLRRSQVGCGGALAARGAVRYQGKYKASTDVLATSQAAVALALKPLRSIDRSGARLATPLYGCATKPTK
jgi:hypothetical protein